MRTIILLLTKKQSKILETEKARLRKIHIKGRDKTNLRSIFSPCREGFESPPDPPLVIVNHFYLDTQVYPKRILHGYRQEHRESESRVPGPQLQDLHEQRRPRPHAEARTRRHPGVVETQNQRGECRAPGRSLGGREATQRLPRGDVLGQQGKPGPQHRGVHDEAREGRERRRHRPGLPVQRLRLDALQVRGRRDQTDKAQGRSHRRRRLREGDRRQDAGGMHERGRVDQRRQVPHEGDKRDRPQPRRLRRQRRLPGGGGRGRRRKG